MLKCISYWSLEGGLAGTCPIEDAISQTKSAGFDGIELAIDREGVLSTQTDQRTCEHYAALAREQGVALQTLASGMSWSCSPTHPDPTTRHLAIALHQDALQRAKWLGCDAVLFVPGATMIPWDPSYPHVPYAEASRWARDAIETLADTAESCGVDLCVENVWNGLFYSPEEFADVIDEIGSPRVGAYLDLGNLMGIHQWPPDWVRHLGREFGGCMSKTTSCR